ncbi:BZ3500_MvSof-1268-A1-R1_Chr5-2g08123 [Microbotryum saponariae]|uniref:BZ3500_MvSof-1268-A1-R1_Chr5-2g08123 protein n=1 Tax=Microbotryum saponariae TaxID=289078 RepID=A0A2X0NEI7_9BASI|nr:BZ3500_MvSof-1268-A1-R1_Chr5-2g08123 [Microbotryum saponariae]SDA05992.1 BZ3501_MvSof-1269-A2-R1_Chr5-2g07945 [Microbotryum saponariae]
MTIREWKEHLLSYIPQSASSQIFLSVTLFETIMQEHVFQTVLKRNEDSVLPVYMGLFILAHIVQLVLAMDAIVAKNTIQVLLPSAQKVALIMFNTLFLAYSIVQILEIKNLIAKGVLRILVWLIPGMILITQITYLATFWFIYRDFGWQVFKRIGADRGIKKAYMWYQVFLVILKFDVFFFLAFSLQLVFLVLKQNDVERWLTVAALPATTAILVCGYLGVRKEQKSLYWIFTVGCGLGLIYFTYKVKFLISKSKRLSLCSDPYTPLTAQLVRIYQLRSTDYVLVFKSLTLFAALCFAALVWTITTSTICYRNFGRGLRYHLMRNKVKLVDESEIDGSSITTSGNNYKLEHRMSLD